MKIVKLEDVIGTERDVEGPGWKSRRLLLKRDGMGFSFHETIIPAGAELHLWYKNHLEAVYCVAGNGTIEDLATGEVHEIRDGVLYALDQHDRLVRADIDERGLNPGQHGLDAAQEDVADHPPLIGTVQHDLDELIVLEERHPRLLRGGGHKYFAPHAFRS